MTFTWAVAGWIVATATATATVAASPALAQTHSRHSAPPLPPASSSPYAGLADRPLKALSAEQIGDLKAGRGMGLALAAELNNYPGPLHVLELAEGLHLSAEQRARTQALIDAMKAESIRLGERLLAQEAELDRLFAERRVTRESLEAATSRIGVLQGELRATHLRYHLTMAEMLSPAQVARYAELRGYSAGGGHSGKH